MSAVYRPWLPSRSAQHVEMQQRNFRTENFQTFHPGGKLGAQMMRAGQLMHGPEKLPIVSAKSSMADTLLEMTSKGFGVAALIENNTLAGLISDGDLRRHMQGLMDKTAADIAANQTGQMLAAMLDAPQGTFASEVDIKDGKVEVTREVDGGLQTLLLDLQAIVTTDLLVRMDMAVTPSFFGHLPIP